VSQVPPGQRRIAGEDIRLGKGKLELVRASREGRTYRTEVDTGSAGVKELWIGHTLPRGSQVESVRLDGEPTRWRERETNRGLEVTVKTGPGEHRLVVRAR
jgi:hypothetical protein